MWQNWHLLDVSHPNDVTSTQIYRHPCFDVTLFLLQPSVQGEWTMWSSRVPQVEVETHKVAAPDVVIPTIDTVRHESLLYTWLAEHKPMVLCGPPGSGKTMTLFSALRALPDLEVSRPVLFLTLTRSPHRKEEFDLSDEILENFIFCLCLVNAIFIIS